jgi:ribosomal protein L7/L12
VTDFLPGKKINAIKELRGLTSAPLKESKEAVEWLMENIPAAMSGPST